MSLTINDFIGEGKLLEKIDFENAALELKCEVAAIKAVAEIESAGKSGFLENKAPKILFESRWFHVLTKGIYDKSHPHLSTPTWIRNYEGGVGEYEDFLEACSLNLDAAIQSTSWGKFQTLGIHWKMLKYNSPLEYTQFMCKSEKYHLDAFIKFVLNSKLDDELREKRWADFARVYNGPGYAKNKYDVKMAKAYAKYSKEN